MITEQERDSFGWLGRIPAVIVEASAPVVAEWKKLAADAKRVARMSSSQKKINEAKKIEARYYALIERATNERKNRAGPS